MTCRWAEHVKTNHWKFTGILGILTGLAGCGSGPFETICTEMEACFGGNDKDIAACVEAYEGLARMVDEHGCRSEFEAYQECRAPLMTCRSAMVGINSCSVSADCAASASPEVVGICVEGMCDFKEYNVDSYSSDFTKCEAERVEWFDCDRAN